MPRANRCFLPGYTWHITHRCHKKEYLLKFAYTRQRYTYWLLQASRRFDVEILNYTEWAYGGYHEIQGRKRRNTIINLPALMDALEIDSVEALRTAHSEWIADALQEGVSERSGLWSESVAVGSEAFALTTQAALGIRGRGRDVVSGDDVCVLREEEACYGADFWVRNKPIAPNIAIFRDVSLAKTES